MKNTLLGTGITMALTFGAYTSINSYYSTVIVNAAELEGEVKVNISSLWTYASPNWSDRKTVVFKGNKFKVKEIINVSGSNMYKLENGLYITASTKYVTFEKGKSDNVIESKSYATTANLNLRTGASTSNRIILTIPKGREVKMISNHGAWAKVTYNGREGYVANKYIKLNSTTIPKPQPEKPKPVEKPSPIVNAGNTTANLNLRAGASTSNRIILTIPKGREVKIISNHGTWSKVTYNGREGYVANRYVKLNSTTMPKPQPEKPKPQPEKPKPQPEKPSETSKKFKTTANLNLRAGATTSNKIILTIPSGREIIEKSRNGAWSKVTYNGREGYVANKYIEEVKGVIPKPEPETPKPEEPESKIFGLTTEHLGIRERKDAQSKSLGTIPKGVSVKILSRDKHWTEVFYEGNRGYVFSHLVIVKAEEEENLPAVLNIDNLKTLYEKEDFKLIGHNVSNSGIKDIQVTLNDKALTVSRVERQDLKPLYGKYKDLNLIGFEINIPKSNIANGTNELVVTSISNDNTQKTNTYHFSVIDDNNFKTEKYNNTLKYYVGLESKTNPKPGHNSIDATMDQIEYYMDPANFVHDSRYKYMFLDLSYNKGDLNVDADSLNVMLNGSGVLAGTGKHFLKAADDYKINPFYLIAHSILETGNGSSTLAKGQKIENTYSKFGDESSIIKDSVPEEDKDKLYYNVFGINAYNSNA
ncbi:MAG: SH3 domain-containing protein, partial [Clostridium sp.]|nr:SH3 domain-containing protein [Clostridium sp.]